MERVNGILGNEDVCALLDEESETAAAELLLEQHFHLLVVVTELAFQFGALFVQDPLERGVSDLETEFDLVAAIASRH